MTPEPEAGSRPGPAAGGGAPARVSWTTLAATAIAVAGLLGWADFAASILIHHRLLNRPLGTGYEIVWLAGTSLLVWSLVPLLIAALARKLRGQRLEVRDVVLVISVFGFYSVALSYGPLDVSAGLLLALGLALALSRLVARMADPGRWFRRAALPVVVVHALSAAGMVGAAWLAERRAAAGLPAAGQGPNVLLIVLDTGRKASMSLHGYDRPTTPNLERRAGEGVLFANAVAPSPWTLPSHATLFTGRYVHELNADFRTSLDSRYPTLAEVLSRSGYATAGFAGNVIYANAGVGLARGFIHYEDHVVGLYRLFTGSRVGRWICAEERRNLRRLLGYYQLVGRKSAEEIGDALLTWLDQRPARPFFAFLNLYDPHDPYLPPPPFDSMFRTAPGSYRVKPLTPRLSAAEVAEAREAYEGAIAYTDAQVEAMLRGLETRGLLDSTVVIVTSDHGEQFNEHRKFTHANSLYAQALDVPLWIRYPPRVPAGRVVERAVTLRDLPVTILDLVGHPEPQTLPGRSLVVTWTDSTAATSPVLAGVRWDGSHKERYSIYAEGFHYIDHETRFEELFHVASDPEETRDLAAAPAWAEVLKRLRGQRDSILAELPPFLPGARRPGTVARR
jgi:arylsulfatase A-like enzyme